MNTMTMTTTTTTGSDGGAGAHAQRIHPHAVRLELPKGSHVISVDQAKNLLLDLIVAVLPEENINPHPVSLNEPTDDNTITTGELVERLATAAKQRDDLRCELHTIAQLSLIASTLHDRQKNILISVIHDRADIQSKKPGRT